MLGAGRCAARRLFALREAKIGVLAAVIAALGAAISEVGAVVIVGGNIQGHDQTLASALIQQFNYTIDHPYGLAIAIVLLVLILVLIGILTVIQQRTGGVQLRFRTGLRCSCIWDEIRKAVPMILHGNPTLLQDHLVHAPGGLRRDRRRDRDRAADRDCRSAWGGSGAGTSCGCSRTPASRIPPVLVGVSSCSCCSLPQAPLGSLHLIWTRRVVFVAQTILALPFVVALDRGRGPGAAAGAPGTGPAARRRPASSSGRSRSGKPGSA